MSAYADCLTNYPIAKLKENRMHEIAMAEKALSIILKSAEDKNAGRVESVKIKIGSLTLLNDEQVRFWFNELSKDTLADNCRISIENIEALIKCTKCGYEGSPEIKDDGANHFFFPDFKCPECKAAEIEIINGKEFEISDICINKKTDQD